MAGILPAVASILAFTILLTILPIAKHRLTLLIASRRRNCAFPPRVPSKDPIFGTDTILSDLRSRKEKRKVKTAYADFARYGKTFEQYLFGRRQVMTCDVRNVQFVLSTEAEKFGNATARRETVSMIGKGIINSDGEDWHKSRGLIMPTFTRSRIADTDFFDKHFRRFMARLPSDGKTVDLKPLFDQLILDASSEFIFGESFDSQLGEEHSVEGRNFLAAFADAQAVVGMRLALGRLSILMHDEKFTKYQDNCDVIRRYTMRHVERALKRRSMAAKAAEDEGRYILVHELAKETTDKEALCDQLVNVFFGGRDTPAVVLANLVFCLARNPEVWRKIREETEGLTAEDLSFEKLKSLRYVQHAINEGLRVLPMLPVIGRTCLAETVLPYGGGLEGNMPVCVIPGDTVIFSVYAMHRETSVFGPDIEAYRPERWQDIRPFWNYLPFSGGARHCPGQQLALFWVSYTLVRLAMEFKEVQNKDPVDEYVENLRLNMESSNGVKVALVRD
ncbi:Nn.00g051360.m01.CDS01 [Neocucurbitaria sp. VM-36]